MSENYYEHPNQNLPNIVESHVDTMCIYIASLFFPQEFIQDPQKAFNRVIISDVNAGSNVGIGDAIEWFTTMSDNFPFVVYNPGMSLPSNDYGNVAAHTLSLTYIEELDVYLRCYPMTMEIQFVAFFNDSLDHRRAITLLGSENSVLTRLYTPILFDNVEVEIPITLSYSLDKGDLASELEAYLSQGRIWNFPFTITIRYYEYILDEPQYSNNSSSPSSVYDLTDIRKKPLSVGKVDDIILRLYKKYSNVKEEAILEDEVYSPDPISIISVSPLNQTEGVLLNSEISVTFSKPINPNTVKDGITISPYTEVDIYYNTDYTIVNFDPVSISGLQTNTQYSVQINQNLKDGDNLSLISDFEFSFKTE